MENNEKEYQKDQFITTEQLIGRALDKGVALGPDPHQTINSYLEKGVLTQLINGTYPSTAVDRLVAIDNMLKEGKSLEEIQEFIQKQRRSFLQKATNLNTMVNLYKNTTFKSILMLCFMTFLVIFSAAFLSSASTSKGFAGNVARTAAKPVGQTLAAFIKAAKPEDTNSTDPLGLTNISKVITINEKEQIVLEKTVVMGQPAQEVATNLNADLLDNANSGTGPGDVLLLDPFGDIIIDGNITIKGVFTGDGSGLANLPLPTTLIYSDQTYANPAWLTSIAWSKLTSRPILLTSIDGVSNDAGNIDFVAGAGVTITGDDVNNTITFNLAGSGVNADLLDSIDSSQFLRSDTSDSFTSGTLTIAGVATLDVLGTFTCAGCVGDAAVVNGLTIDATGSVAAAAVTGPLTDAQVSNTLTIDATGSVSGTAVNSGTLGAAGVTLALASFGSITGSLGDATVADTLTIGSSSSVSATALNSGTLGNAGVTLALGSFGSITGSLGDANVANSLTVDATSSVSAAAVNSGTLGNAAVTLALGSFGSITGSLGDTNVADTITVSNYLPLAGGTMAGNIDFNTSLALNIGNAGTDFTATGGLNLAENLDVAGHAGIGASANPVASTLLQLFETISGEEIVNGIQSYPTSSYNDALGTPQIFGIRSVPTYSGADTGATVIGTDTIAQYSGAGSASSLIALRTGITTTGGSGAVTAVKGISIGTPSLSGAVPSNVYGLEINDLTVGTNRYPIYQGGTNGTNVFLAGTSLFGRTASGNDTLYQAVIQGSVCVDDTTANCPAGPTAGAIYVENSVGAGNVSAFDISEYYPATEPTEKGEIVAAAGNSAVRKSSKPYDPAIVGIVSTDPAIVINETNITFGKTAGDNFNPLKPYVALAGRVPVKVSTENGSIEPGNPLTSSSTPGVAMKATRSGSIVGKALEAYSGSGVGKIMVFVSVGWYVASLENSEQQTGNGFSSIDTQTLTAGTVNTQVLIIGDRKITMEKNGKLRIDGDVQIDGELIAKKVITDELVVGDQTSGSGTIQAGTKELTIPTDKVGDKTKILITFTTDYSPATRYWVTKKVGESFTVHLDQPVGFDATFDWLVVN